MFSFLLHQELQLYGFLSRYYHIYPNAGSKILVFVNAVSYVYRLEPLFQILFKNGSIGEFKSILNRKQLPKTGIKSINSANVNDDKDDHDDTVKKRKESNKSEGVILLNDLFKERARNTNGEEKSKKLEDSSNDASGQRNRKQKVKRKNKQQNCENGKPIEIIGIHSKLKQSQRLKKLER